MSDIVERLRVKYDWNKPTDTLCYQAADEIERLQGEIKAMREMVGEIDRQHQVETERLRAMVARHALELAGKR